MLIVIFILLFHLHRQDLKVGLICGCELRDELVSTLTHLLPTAQLVPIPIFLHDGVCGVKVGVRGMVRPGATRHI